MKLNLSSLLCLIGVPFVLSIQNWTQIGPFLIKQQASWQVAQNYCLENHLDLFTITNPRAQMKLINEMNNHNVIGPVWTGLYNDMDSWYWSYEHLPLKNTSVMNWGEGQPDNTYAEDVCGVVYMDGTWMSINCLYAISFICYDVNIIANNGFIGYPRPFLTWYNARAYCQYYHTDLARITNAADISPMVQYLSSIKFFRNWAVGWFGLTRDTWKWSDGTKPSYLPWLSGQPDNYYYSEYCGAAKNGLLTDEKCTNEHYFVCSAYLFRTQIVKLQVKSDSSVLDPAVQSAILDLINQKLQKNGMGVNTTVKWKVQPDGNIFYKNVKKN